MAEISIRAVIDENGTLVYECIDQENEIYVPMKRRVMNEQETRERVALNIANTSEVLFKRAQRSTGHYDVKKWQEDDGFSI